MSTLQSVVAVLQILVVTIHGVIAYFSGKPWIGDDPNDKGQ